LEIAPSHLCFELAVIDCGDQDYLYTKYGFLGLEGCRYHPSNLAFLS